MISGSALLATFALLMAQTCPCKQIAVPVNAPSVIEEIVAPYGVQVIRTRADVRSLMNAAAENAETLCFAGDTQGGLIFPQFHPGFDAMFAYVRLLEATQKLGCTLSEVYDQIPPFYTQYRALPCPWELKGRVMRLLAQEVNGRTETIDGLKVYTDHSWALALPDASEPLIHIFVESRTPEAAEQLLAQFVALVERFTQKP